MKLRAAILLAGILFLTGLAGCGGGGGSAGATSSTATVAPGTSAPPGATGTATCSSFATQQQAQVALGNGEFQLDPNGDGIACNE